MKTHVEKGWLYVAGSKTDRPMPFDGTWNERLGAWRVPCTVDSVAEVGKKYPSDALREVYTTLRERYLALMKLKDMEDTEGDARLRPYQRVDVAFLKRLPHAGLFSSPRTGKTPTALLSIETTHTIVVCPASIVLQWAKEVETWTDMKAVPIIGTKKQREAIYNGDTSGVWIISYETLRNDSPLIKHTGFTLIVDEAHRLCNHKTLQSRAVFSLGLRAKKRLALTGTPTRSHGVDIWGILHFLYPDRFPGYWGFAQYYFYVTKSYNIMGYKRKQSLTNLISMLSTSRKREDVMAWLPKKQRIRVPLQFNPKQKKVYTDVLETFEYEDLIDAPSVLAQLTRLRQITLAPKLLGVDAPSPKEKWLLDQLEGSDESMVVFSNFTSYLKDHLCPILQKQGVKVSMIHGEMNRVQKDESVQAFQNGEVQVILANIQSAKEGLTLDRASTAIFLDRSYVPTDNQQAEDRIIPVSEERNHACTVIDLEIQDSVDEKVNAIVSRKEKLINVINNIGLKNFIKQG